MTVVVVTDTSCRLPADLREQWSIRQVPLHILLDGLDLRDGVDEIPDDIHKRHATTAGATPVELSAAYQRALADSGGDGVVAVHISSALSGTFRAAELTAAELGPAVRVIDSRSAAMGVGFAALAAGRAAAAGDELDTVARAAAAAVSRIHAFVAVARLDNLRRSGRISGPVAALHASEGGIYGRFGYGPATTLHELTVDRRFARFHADAPGGGLGGSSVRLVRPTEHRGEFEAIYERWRQQVPGGLLRPQVLWDELLAECKAAPGGDRESFALLHPDGYALYRVDRTDLKLARVSELRAVTADAHCALWRALIGLDSMERISIITHPQDPLPHLLTDTRLARTTWRQDGLWLRIMNVPAALEARGYAHEVGEFSTVLEVSDGGRFALKIGDGRARCTPTDAAAEIEMDRDVLGSLYLGAHRASTLAAANRLRTKDSQLLRRLDAAFASDVPVQTAFEF